MRPLTDTSPRSWLYNTLLNDGPLSAVVADRVIQGGGLRDANVTVPFIVYHLGNDTDENLAESGPAPHRQFFQVYVHDDSGDYTRIDNIGYLVKNALRNGTDRGDILTIRYLETSQDLSDETLNTIFRYLRFQFIMV